VVLCGHNTTFACPFMVGVQEVFVTVSYYCKRICQLVLAVSMATLAMAQNDRGIIAGTVQDPTGAVIPDVAVNAKNTATGAAYETRTTATGDYTLASLPPGIYEISVQAAGFEKYVGTGTQVQVGQIEHINITLKVGAATDTVTVNATAPLLKVDSSEQSVDVGRQSITDLSIPGNGSTRNARSLMIITPGVAGQGEPQQRTCGRPATQHAARLCGRPGRHQREQPRREHWPPAGGYGSGVRPAD
jgi:hypothetical protein